MRDRACGVIGTIYVQSDPNAMPGNYGPPFMRLQCKRRDATGLVYADGSNVRIGACFVFAIAAAVSSAWIAGGARFVGDIIRSWPDMKFTPTQLVFALPLLAGLVFLGFVARSVVYSLVDAFQYREWHLSPRRAELRTKAPFRPSRSEVIDSAGVARVHVVDRPWRNRAEPHRQVWLESTDGSQRLVDHGREAAALQSLAEEFAASLCVPLVLSNRSNPLN